MFPRPFGWGGIMSEDWTAEFAGLPEYVVSHHRTEKISLGVRVYHWRQMGAVLVPQFTAVLSPLDLAMIGRDVHEEAIRALSTVMPIGVLKN